ncbi:membrane protein, putative [Babesia bigemina]|uniref:Membrane protein, putative n=1 Tax=Babesia bigemina TaxID=5866 RepID=A0A061CZX5_BABBI|nr:membrane protein, putative [Babesia bigemina]CDR93968.1 membrane protein, putative [Babesia bigemina]|eukprot:XP_012766154.1 membrane protein, putative [Babesia bigemina]
MLGTACVYTLFALLAAHVAQKTSCEIANAANSAAEVHRTVSGDPKSEKAADPETEIRDIIHDTALKKELSEAGEKVAKSAEVVDESRKSLDNITKEREDISKAIGHAKVDRANELRERKRELLKKIAAIGKTLRLEHDARYPHLAGQPIVLVAKNEDDTKRAASTLAHIEGLRDAINQIRSPCSSLERVRSAAMDTSKQNRHNRFVIVQKTLDSMSAEERLHYDRNMIEHYEGIIREIEDSIAKADEEIAASWQNYKQ